jgi:hypothetical protein
MLDFDPQSPDHTSVTFANFDLQTRFLPGSQKLVKKPKQLFSSLKSEQWLRLFGEMPDDS